MSHNSESFNFNTEIQPTNWLIDGLIPLGQMLTCIARSSQGKSWLAEAIAISIVYNKPFLDRAVSPGDVLIIDQDTPKDTITQRLVSFSKRFKGKPKHNLYLKSHEGLAISNKSLLQTISEYPDVKLIIIDSWHSVLGGLDSNSTNDTNHACNQLIKTLSPSKTIWINHHISEKKLAGLPDLMFGENIGNLFMGNSALVQRADTIFVVNGVTNNGVLHEMCIRPHGKRAYIGQQPFLAKFENFEFIFAGNLENMKDFDDCVSDLRMLFTEKPDCGFKVKEAYDEMGRKHGINKVYQALAHMESTGEARMERGSSNQFKYFPTSKTKQPKVIYSGIFVDDAQS